MDLHKDFPALKDGKRISEKEDKRISQKIDHLLRDFPIVDSTLQSGRLAKNAVVQKGMLRDVELLFEWMKSKRPTADTLANEVFADWDTRRSLLQLDLQEVLLEKQNTMLRIVDSKMEEEPKARESAKGLVAETYLIRSKLSALMGKHSTATRFLHLSRYWNSGEDFASEVNLEEAKQLLRITALDKESVSSNQDVIKAKQMMMTICAATKIDLGAKPITDEGQVFQNEHRAECHILLAKIYNRFDLGQAIYRQYNETADIMHQLNIDQYRKTTGHFYKLQSHIGIISVSIKCTDFRMLTICNVLLSISDFIRKEAAEQIDV